MSSERDDSRTAAVRLASLLDLAHDEIGRLVPVGNRQGSALALGRDHIVECMACLYEYIKLREGAAIAEPCGQTVQQVKDYYGQSQEEESKIGEERVGELWDNVNSTPFSTRLNAEAAYKDVNRLGLGRTYRIFWSTVDRGWYVQVRRDSKD